jgi:hypothetical protein
MPKVLTKHLRLHGLSADGLALVTCGEDDSAGCVTSAHAPGAAAGATVRQAPLEVGPLKNNGAPDAANAHAHPVQTKSPAQDVDDLAPPQTLSEAGTPLQIGVGRAIPQAADIKAMAGLLSRRRSAAAASGSPPQATNITLTVSTWRTKTDCTSGLTQSKPIGGFTASVARFC